LEVELVGEQEAELVDEQEAEQEAELVHLS